MNKQTVEGKLDQVAGKIKEKFGEATGNEKLANSGVADQVKGAAKETWGHTKDAAQDAAKAGSEHGSTLTDRAEASAHDLREKITSATQNAKEKIAEKLDQFKQQNRS